MYENLPGVISMWYSKISLLKISQFLGYVIYLTLFGGMNSLGALLKLDLIAF